MPKVVLIDHPTREEWLFHCPGCLCGHSFRVDPTPDGGPRWTWNGDPDRPTVNPSLYVNPPSLVSEADFKAWKDSGGKVERCHSFIRDGKIQFLTDCTHALAGQTVEIPDWDAS